MTIARHLDALAVYGAGALRIVPHDGDDEVQLGEGGALEARFDELGRGPLIDVLRDGGVSAVTLADGALEIEAARSGAGARLVVKFDGKTVVDEAIELPPASAVTTGPAFRPDPRERITDISSALSSLDQPLHAVEDELGHVVWYGAGLHGRGLGERPYLGRIPEMDPGQLGSRGFCETHHTRWAYVAGAMAGGIASAELVIAMANSGLLAFFGAGGLPLPAVEENVARISKELEGRANWGCNLLNNPMEPAVEERTVDLYLKFGVRRVSASAYMGLSPAVVRYRLSGLRAGPAGEVICDNHVLAKVSRPEVAEKFLRPAPKTLIDELVSTGAITAEQGRLGEHVPIACDITAEGDSGGHTDHRPLLVLLPILQQLRDQIAAEQVVKTPLRVGAAGGLGTPASLWAAFAMGADYVLTGSVNQATREAGTSDVAKAMLVEAAYTDVATGPAPDMFELGAHVQVLSRGSMYARRAQLLYEIYKAYPSMEEIPQKERNKVEKQILQRPMAEVWEGTRAYWAERDPRQVEKADKEPRHKMALTFRWYLGMTSRWARIGEESRKRDYQVWCGPAMGGFNSWVAGRDLEPLQARGVVEVATALMNGAAAESRRSMGRSLQLL